MAIKYNNLAALVSKESGKALPVLPDEPMTVAAPAPPPAPLPTPSEVLYLGPNSDGTRKACSNCYAYAPGQRRCYIHQPTLDVDPAAVCGYHVFTRKTVENFSPEFRLPMDYVTPAQSGLVRVPGGTSCDLCSFYEPTGLETGLCHGVADVRGSNEPAQVHPLGCCARWLAK